MSFYYFGLHPYFWQFLAIVSFFGVIAFIIRKVMNSSFNRTALTLSVFVFIGALFCQHASNELDATISHNDASRLQGYYKKSAEYSRNGYDFRVAMSDLAEKNHVLVDGDFSYLGSDIYMDYVTKKDWNDLAKIYNNSNIPN